MSIKYIRHAESHYNILEQHNTRTTSKRFIDCGLTQIGVSQAKNLPVLKCDYLIIFSAKPRI